MSNTLKKRRTIDQNTKVDIIIYKGETIVDIRRTLGFPKYYSYNYR